MGIAIFFPSKKTPELMPPYLFSPLDNYSKNIYNDPLVNNRLQRSFKKYLKILYEVEIYYETQN